MNFKRSFILKKSHSWGERDFGDLLCIVRFVDQPDNLVAVCLI